MVHAASRCCCVSDVIDEPVDLSHNMLIVFEIAVLLIKRHLPYVKSNGWNFEKSAANRTHRTRAVSPGKGISFEIITGVIG